MKARKDLVEATLKSKQDWAPLTTALLAYGYVPTVQTDEELIMQAGNRRVRFQLEAGGRAPSYIMSKIDEDLPLTEVRNILTGHPGFTVEVGDVPEIHVVVRESHGGFPRQISESYLKEE